MSRELYMVVGSAFILAACGNSPVAPLDLEGEPWQLVSLQEAGAAPVTIDNPTRYTVAFTEGGRLAVVSDCNRCGGRTR